MSEPFRGGLDTLDEKVKFLIETCEHFIDIDFLMQAFQKQARENAKAFNLDEHAAVTYNRTETWRLVICHMAVQWAISKRIPPQDLSSSLNTAMNVLYSVDINEKLSRLYPGDDGKENSSDDYSS